MRQSTIILHSSKRELKDSNVLVAACPSFKIDQINLNVDTDSLRLSEDDLLDCIELEKTKQIKSIGFILGASLLCYDISILKNIEIKESKKESDESLTHPQTEIETYAKSYAQDLEKRFFAAKLKLQPHKEKFLFSGDLLNNPECNTFFLRLSTFCNSNKSSPLNLKFETQIKKFEDQHFKEILGRKDLVSKYNQKSISEIVRHYTRLYTLFEFSMFAYLGKQGFNILVYTQVNDQLRQTMDMTMAFFSKTLSGPEVDQKLVAPLLTKAQKMEIHTIEFQKKRSLSEEKPKNKSIASLSRSSTEPTVLREQHKSKLPITFDSSDTNILQVVFTSNHLTPEEKQKALNMVAQSKIIAFNDETSSFTTVYPSVEETYFPRFLTAPSKKWLGGLTTGLAIGAVLTFTAIGLAK